MEYHHNCNGVLLDCSVENGEYDETRGVVSATENRSVDNMKKYCFLL